MPAVSIADHASATECESSDEVAQLAVAVAHVVAQQRPRPGSRGR